MSHEVMVVDDDDEIRETICEALEDEGYVPVGLANGQLALDHLRASAMPCMMFLDLMMPVMDGWEVLRQCGADPALAKLPVVVITASGPRAPKVTANRVLQKPFRIERVLEAAKEFC